MTGEYSITPLGELCDVLDNKRKPITKKNRIPGPYPYYGATGILDYVEDYLFDEPLVLIGEDGAKWGVGERTAFSADGKYWVNNHAHVIRPYRDKVLDSWITYYLNTTDLSPFITGLTVPKLNQGKLREIPIPVLPLLEQKRIVAILDEAFAGIDIAIANTGKNLANARELFESYLESVAHDKQPLGKYVNIKTGKLNANAAVEGGEFPFFTCSREIYEIDHYAFDCEAILLAGNNAAGDFNVKHYKGKFNAYQRTYVITINDDKSLSYRFLYFQLLKSLKELKNTSVGAGTKFLKLGMIQNLRISVPAIDKQEEVLEKLEFLMGNSKHLESIYQQKLNSLKELKQSLLQKAFSGELTSKPDKPIDEAVT